MTTTARYREIARSDGRTHGEMSGVEATTVADAETYLREFPRDRHGFACCASISIEAATEAAVRARVSEIMRDAGYAFDHGDRPWYKRDGYRASAQLSERITRGPGGYTIVGVVATATISVYRDGETMAYAAGSGGALNREDRPTLD